MIVLQLLLLTFSATAQPPAAAGANIPDWPVPKFSASDKPIQFNSAALLRTRYEELHSHLCNRPKPVTDAWKRKYAELVSATIEIQHRTLWTVAGGVRAGNEGDKLQGFFDLKREMQRLLEREAAASPRDSAELLAIRDRFNNDTERFQASIERSDYGGSVLTGLAFRVVVRQLERDLRGPVATRLSLASKLKARLNTAHKDLDRFLFGVYVNTSRELNRTRLPAGTGYVVFSMTSTDPDLYQEWSEKDYVAGAMNAFFTTIGHTYRDLDWKNSDVYLNAIFSAATGLKVLGPCRSGIVEVAWSPSRRDDANKASVLLRDKGFETRLSAVSEESAKANRGKLFVHHYGTASEAAIIRDHVKGIESVTAVDPPWEHKSDVVHYTLWLTGKKDEPETSANPVEATPPAEAEAVSTIGWDTSFGYVGHFNANANRHVRICPPHQPNIWYRGVEGGPTYYGPDSGVCGSAVHAGIITFEKGGKVVFAYDQSEVPRTSIGSTRNGVTSTTLTDFRFNWYFIR